MASKVKTKDPISKPLDARESVFRDEYLVDLDPRRAALAAGYSATVAKTRAYQWVSNSEIKPHLFEAIHAAKQRRSERTEITQDRVLEEIAKVAFASMRQFISIDGDGNPKISLAETPDAVLDALSEIHTETVLEKKGKGPEEEPDIIRKVKIKLHSKLDALEKLAQHTGVYKKRDEDQANALAVALREIMQRGSKMPLRKTTAPDDGVVQ